jgi:hypothetical protein
MELENKPPSSALAQQKLQSWDFSLSNKAKGLVYIITGLFFILMGTLIIVASDSVIEHKKRYDNISGCKAGANGTCFVDFDISEHMDSKVFVYYEIENMYQNHRAYTKSISPKQMQGSDLSKNDIDSSCDPVTKVNDLAYPFKESTNLDKNAVANPCGLIAKSVFSDYFLLLNLKTLQPVNISSHNIALYEDKEDKFKNSSKVDEKRWINVKDGKFYVEHFIVWVSIAATPTFRKLWGKIDGLDKGAYRMFIASNYDVDKFAGKKSIILTTSSPLGGKMDYLGILAVVIGSTSIIGSGLFFFEEILRARREKGRMKHNGG